MKFIHLFFLSLLCFKHLSGSETPNFIIIMTDDQGYADLGCFGSENIKTPHIDRMAKEGMRFTSFYSGSPVCTPSRASLLTGSYAARVGNMSVLFPRHHTGLNPQEETIAEVLKAKNYASACIGKWHLGHLKEFLPTSQGFDYYYGIPYSNDMSLDPNMTFAKDVKFRHGMTKDTLKVRKNLVPLMRGEEVIEYPVNQNTITKRYTEEALQFIEKNKNRPFFLYLPHTMPHIPLFVSKEFEGKSDMGLYGDSIEEIDWSTGQILERLRQLKLDQKTFVIFTSDNGPWRLNQKSWIKGNKNRRVGGIAKPLRGYKFMTYEGGMRVPTVMWWPGQIPAGKVCDEVVASMDLLPTFAKISGAPLPEQTIDGKNILPLLQGVSGAKSPHEYLFLKGESVRAGAWKLKGSELYHLGKDISERKNLAQTHPDKVKALKAQLEQFNAKMARERRPIGQLTQK